jgi:phosphoribosylformimino-5-aminoimidazole carboxamide ribotide isomerase
MARRWVEEGAKYLHVVDLDGAFQGRPAHTEVIGQIVRAIDIPVEVGGGLRTDEDVRALLAVGVDRAIVGTRAWAEPETLQRLAGQFGRQLAVGIDARDGRVQVKGWVETTEQLATDLARKAEAMGVECIIYTDTSKDGMMAGTNVRAMDEMCGAVTCSVIASGGVTSRTDAEALRGLKRRNLVGAIVGKALYEGRVTLKELEA